MAAEVMSYSRARASTATLRSATPGEAGVGLNEPRKPKKLLPKGVIFTAATAVAAAGLELLNRRYPGTPAFSDLIAFFGGNSGNPSPEDIQRMKDSYNQVHNLTPTPGK
jgi:hypothetical protein